MLRCAPLLGRFFGFISSILLPARHDRRRFLFALTIVSIITSKFVHILASTAQTPIDISWIIFFPTFWIKDVIALALVALALYPAEVKSYASRSFNSVLQFGYVVLGTCSRVYNFLQSSRLFSLFAVLYIVFFGVLLPLISASAASCELWIYAYSGVTVIWRESLHLMADPKDFAPQMADMRYGDLMVIWFIVLVVLARFERSIVGGLVRCCFSRLRKNKHTRNVSRLFENDAEAANGSTIAQPRGSGEEDKEGLLGFSDYSNDDEERTEANFGDNHNNNASAASSRAPIAPVIFLLVCILSWFQPVRIYDLVANSVPYTLLDVLPGWHKESDGVGSSSGNNLMMLGFPFPGDVIMKGPADSSYKDVDFVRSYLSKQKPMPEGFKKYTAEREDAWRRWAWDSTVAQMNGTSSAKGKVDLHLAPAGYHHAYDPMKIANLDLDLRPELTVKNPPNNAVGATKQLKDVKIRNILHIVMESTRADVFPIREGNHYAKMLREHRTRGKTYDDNFGDLTPFANLVSGKEIGKGGAGVVVHGANSQTTYSLKSHLLNFCGMQPMSVGFSQESRAEFYQPCLPHILKAVGNDKNASKDDWRSFPWTTTYMQTSTTDFDNHPTLLKMTGFNKDNDEIIASDTFKNRDKAKHFADEGKVNSMGWREHVLNPYLEDIIRDSKKNNKRFHAGIWTVSAHGVYATPPKEWWKKLELTDEKGPNDYMNAVAFQDRWLSEIVELLKKEGVYEETLLVVQGDHGAPLTTDAGPDIKVKDQLVENPHFKCFQIPIVFHHPHLPSVHVQANATNLSILPTILDLLANSDSTVPGSDTANFIKGMIPTYEGQSLLRPLKDKTPGGFENYRFSLPNNGGFMMVVDSSDAKQMHRFSVPLSKEFQFTASDLKTDPREARPIRAWTEEGLLQEAEKKWGKDTRQWIEKGIRLTDWWRVEIVRRWRYGDFAPPKDGDKKKSGN